MALINVIISLPQHPKFPSTHLQLWCHSAGRATALLWTFRIVLLEAQKLVSFFATTDLLFWGGSSTIKYLRLTDFQVADLMFNLSETGKT